MIKLINECITLRVIDSPSSKTPVNLFFKFSILKINKKKIIKYFRLSRERERERDRKREIGRER